MKMFSLQICCTVAGLALFGISRVPVHAAEPSKIAHRFLAIDESRGQTLFVDETQPSNNWVIATPGKCRDYQLIGNQQLLLNASDGYLVYSLVTRKLVKEFHDARFGGAVSVRRLVNGHTVIGCNKEGITFYEIGADDAILRTVKFPALNTLRLARMTAAGTLVFGCNGTFFAEADLDGKILQKIEIPGAKHIYQVLRKPNGNWLVSTGYGHAFVELDPAGKELRRFGGDPSPADMNFHFFSGFQVLKNGNTVVCNWTGHGRDDSTKGVQLVEFNAEGKPVWTWHDPAAAGTLHGVIILDGLDASVLHDDINGVLGPIR